MLFSDTIRLERIIETFSLCKNITSIAAGTFKYNNNIIDFSRCFSECTKLKTIPEELFRNITIPSDPTECFIKCTSLLNVPDLVFPKMTRTAYGIFNGCTSLRTVSLNAFSGCANISTFDYAFANTQSLNYIGDVFDNCNSVKSFNSTFYKSGISSVSANLSLD